MSGTALDQTRRKKFIPLSRKLLLSGLFTILVAFTIFGGVVAKSMNQLAGGFFSLNEKRTERSKETLEKTFQKNAEKIQTIYQTALESKGRRLIEKDSASVQPMVDDNSFGAVREFLLKNFKGDKDIVYASYFVHEDGETKAWQIVSRQHPDGLELPIEFDTKSSRWKASSKKGGQIQVVDAELPRILKLEKPEVRLKTIQAIDSSGAPARFQVYDCVIPMISQGKVKKTIAQARSNGETIGYLRYILSLEQMERAIAEERRALETELSRLAEENAKLADESSRIVRGSINQSFLILGASAAVVLFLAYIFSLISSRLVTRPVNQLTAIAQDMAGGNYKQQVKVTSNDEIGLLAESFREMAAAILKRDEELAEINRNLEKLVEMRTLQLKEQLRTVSNLLNNMKQAVFAVSKDGTIAAPVSRFSEQVFGGTIEGNHLFSTVYKDIGESTEMGGSIRTVISTVFGENELQWGLMEDNLPREVSYRPEGAPEDRTLKIAYSPLWNDQEALDQLMFVVEDITDVLALKKKVESEKAASARNIQMIQELASIDPKELRALLGSLQKLISHAGKAIQTSDWPLLLRNLHTIKGNARVFNLSFLGSITHEQENQALQVSRENETDAIDPAAAANRLQDILVQVQKSLNEYSSLAKKVFAIPDEFEAANLDFIHATLLSGDEQIKKDRASLVSSLRNIGKDQLAEGLQNAVNHFPVIQESLETLVKIQTERREFVAPPRDPESWGLLLTHLLDYMTSQKSSEEKGTQAHSNLAQKIRLLDPKGRMNLASRLASLLERGNDASPLLQMLLTQIRGVLSYACKELLGQLEQKEISSWLISTPSDSQKAIEQIATETRFGSFIPQFLKTLAERNWTPNQILTKLQLSAEQLLGFDDPLQAKPNSSRTDLNYAWDVDLALLRRVFSIEVTEGPPRGSSISMVEVPETSLTRLRRLLQELASQEESTLIGKLKHAAFRLEEVPIRNSLAKYFPMVKEISQRLDKNVRFALSGDEITLPREDLTFLDDALVHMIRNALDHGLELPEDRLKAGKSDEGTLEIQCFEGQTQSMIVIRDDGRGIDINALVNRAIEKGFLKADRIQQMTTEQKLDLMFIPGLSTKREATDLSGRGIGMDVVRTNLNKIGATLEVQTRVQTGTQFKIVLKRDRWTETHAPSASSLN
jgi:chemotaxis protein histidine kinase CheA/HAMP domain-containing protein